MSNQLSSYRILVVSSLLSFLFITEQSNAQNETIKTASFLINMGNTNTTSINNDIRPYGMIYDLMRNYQVPVKWVINQSKLKDGADFTLIFCI
jgi:hypothetical protein